MGTAHMSILPQRSSTPIALDNLQSHVLDNEPDLDGVQACFWGCLMLSTVLLDLWGNVAGIPFISGTFIKMLELTAMDGASIVVTVFHATLILASCLAIFYSPWRIWLVEITQKHRKRPSSLTRGANWLQQRFSIAIESGLAKFAMLALTGLYLLAIIGSGWVSIHFVFFLLVFMVSISIFLSLNTLGDVASHVFRDQASVSGVLLGMTLNLLPFLFISVPRHYTASFLADVWGRSEFVPLRLSELFFFTMFGSWLLLLSRAQLHNNLVLFVTAPNNSSKVLYDFSSLAKFVGRRITVNFDTVLMRDTIVLKHFDGRHFETVSPAQPLLCSEQPYLILYLPALQSIGSGFSLRDRRGFFEVQAQLCAQPRGLAERELGVRVPAEALEALLGLLNSTALEQELQRTVQASFDDFVRQIEGMGERMDIRFAELAGQVDDILLKVETGLRFQHAMNSNDANQLLVGLSDLEKRESAFELLRECRGQGAKMSDRWLEVIGGRLEAQERVESGFLNMCQGRYVRTSTGYNDDIAESIFNHLGLGVALTFKPYQQQLDRGKRLTDDLNKRCRSVRDKLMEQLDRSQERLLSIYLETRKLSNEREQLAMQNMFGLLPQLFPYFRNRPEQLMRFMEFAMQRIQGPVTFQQLQNLLAASSSSPIPQSQQGI